MIPFSFHSALRRSASLVPLVAGLLPGLLLAGCAAGVAGSGPLASPHSADAIAASQSLAVKADAAWPADGWWQAFGDAQLDALITEGLAQSPDVAAAAARLARAEGVVRQAGAATLPTLDGQGQATVDKQSYNNGFPKAFVPQGWLDNGRVAASLSYDLDLWGKNRAALAAATSDAHAAAIDGQQARLLLSVGIASAYVDLARLFAEQDVRTSALAMRQATLDLVKQRLANGLDARGSLRQAEAQVATAQADLSAAEEAIALRRHQLAALLGAGPDRGLAIARPAFAAAVLANDGLPAGVTTDLVGRRPDIAAARDRVEAAASRIKVARAAFFPAISLRALIGVQALGLDNLFVSDSTMGSAGPAISLPLFHGGELRGRYGSARATYDEAVADYDRTVLAAYQQTADAVTSRRLAGAQLADAQRALAAMEDAHALARRRYEGGLSTYLDVLAVEDRLLQARQAAALLDARVRTLDIALIRALGGGFAAQVGPNLKDATHG